MEKVFEVLNVRLGFANNSSSTHSIILVPRGAAMPSDDDTGGSYGWETFTLATPEAKKSYLSQVLQACFVGNYNAERNLTQEEVDRISAELLGVRPEAGGGVDHQSLWTLPLSWDGKGPDLEFFEELRDFVLKPRLVILGGNDNGGDHPLAKEKMKNIDGLPRDSGEPLVARKDSRGYWTLFNRRSGNKYRVRVRLGDRWGDRKVAPEKADTPELVDVKITDACPFRCAYCYQGSLPNAPHAPLAELKELAKAMGRMRVFEVALGGGEPTLHPEFVETLAAFKSEGVIPNFTTFRHDWLRKPEEAAKIMHVAGSFAVSCDSAQKVRDLHESVRIFREWRQVTWPKPEDRPQCATIAVQYVMGTTSLEELEALAIEAKRCGFELTLLGYKQTGRGHEFKPKSYKNWPKLLLETPSRDAAKRLGANREFPRVGIDTALAAESTAALKRLKVPAWMYSTKEGQFSMYVDAVEKKAGPSSFCPEEQYVPVHPTAWEPSVRAAFATW